MRKCRLVNKSANKRVEGEDPYLHVAEVSLDATDHLRFLKHFFGIGHGRRLLPPLDRSGREVVSVVMDSPAGHSRPGC